MKNLRMLIAVVGGIALGACGSESAVAGGGATGQSEQALECKCPAVVGPIVCGKDGVTYPDKCHADCAGTGVVHEGACGCACPTVWDPVCGVDGKTYGNKCVAACYGVDVDRGGACGPVIPANP